MEVGSHIDAVAGARTVLDIGQADAGHDAVAQCDVGELLVLFGVIGLDLSSGRCLLCVVRRRGRVSVQIGSNDAFVPCIVALGNATNWKSEKLAATILAGDLRNEGSGSTMSAIYRSIKAMNLTKAERDATWNLLFSGMSKICDETYPKTSAALISIVQEIRNLNPDAQIILVGYTNPVPLIPCWRSYFNKLNKFEKQIAKTYNLTYVAIPNTETTLDVHPTIKGHQYIANKLVNAIENP